MKKKDKPFYSITKLATNRNIKKSVYDKIYNRTFLLVSYKFEDYSDAIPDKLFDKWWSASLLGIMSSL